MDTFKRLSPFIQEYIYRCGWIDLREVQTAACEVIFHTGSNLLLSAGTASGKTEAAFLPVLTLLAEQPSASVGIMYVSPLKALINDQFIRLEELLREAHIPICKWHGDSSQSGKAKLLKKPEGVLQITPESLESLLMKRPKSCSRLFNDLRFIIIDEVHHFMSNERGLQLLCQLERIQRLAHCKPRRIGLSATLPDYSAAEAWLNTGSGRPCATPKVKAVKRRLGVQMRRFAPDGSGENISQSEFLYRQTLDKKAIIFAKSRAEVEEVISGIRRIAKARGTKDIYYTHHGSISKALRAEAEQDMKHSETPIVTGATLTLELGIDIGSLDRVIQIGSPSSVSSLAQRVGRCGRRGQAAELLFTFEEHDAALEGFSDINWEFIKTIAILQLFLQDHWIEPIPPLRFPYSLLYHQTMSYMVTAGEVPARQLALNVLSLAAFRHIPPEDYKLMLKRLIALEHLQRTEDGGLIVGRRAETLIHRHEFYSVFETPTEYIVQADGQVIGTIMSAQEIGNVFALAGRAWEVVYTDDRARIIFAEQTHKKPGSGWITPVVTDLSPEVLNKMRHVLSADEGYAYMSEDCMNRLNRLREYAGLTGLTSRLTSPLSKNRYAVFPWLGTRDLTKLRLALADERINCTVSPNTALPVYLEVETTSDEETLNGLIKELLSKPIDKYTLTLPESAGLPGKFNRFVPEELLRKQYLKDYL